MRSIQRLAITVTVCAGPVVAHAQPASNICGTTGSFAVFAVRPLGHLSSMPVIPEDRSRVELVHEHLFFCRAGSVVDNLGFGPVNAMKLGNQPGAVFIEPADQFPRYRVIGRRYNLELMSRAVGPRQCTPATYNLLLHNCQDFAAGMRSRYWTYALEGDWVSAGYGCADRVDIEERVQISVNAAGGMAAVKRTGDPCVPAPSPTFQGHVPADFAPGVALLVSVTLGTPDAPASASLDDQLLVHDENGFSLGHGGLTFRRATPIPIPQPAGASVRHATRRVRATHHRRSR